MKHSERLAAGLLLHRCPCSEFARYSEKGKQSFVLTCCKALKAHWLGSWKLSAIFHSSAIGKRGMKKGKAWARRTQQSVICPTGPKLAQGSILSSSKREQAETHGGSGSRSAED